MFWFSFKNIWVNNNFSSRIFLSSAILESVLLANVIWYDTMNRNRWCDVEWCISVLFNIKEFHKMAAPLNIKIAIFRQFVWLNYCLFFPPLIVRVHNFITFISVSFENCYIEENVHYFLQSRKKYINLAFVFITGVAHRMQDK